MGDGHFAVFVYLTFPGYLTCDVTLLVPISVANHMSALKAIVGFGK